MIKSRQIIARTRSLKYLVFDHKFNFHVVSDQLFF